MCICDIYTKETTTTMAIVNQCMTRLDISRWAISLITWEKGLVSKYIWWGTMYLWMRVHKYTYTFIQLLHSFVCSYTSDMRKKTMIETLYNASRNPFELCDISHKYVKYSWYKIFKAENEYRKHFQALWSFRDNQYNVKY